MGTLSPLFAERNNAGPEPLLTEALSRIQDLLGARPGSPPEVFAQALPFGAGDTTFGAENELQAVVTGASEHVDLPIIIQQSNYYQNLMKRTGTGESPRRSIADLENFINDNTNGIWENSWVRFHHSALNDYSRSVFARDLAADRHRPEGPRRRDADRFTVTRNGETYIRIPVSYLIKLALADALADGPGTHAVIRSVGEGLMDHFINDNTSPETTSFHPVLSARNTAPGEGIARETAKRYLLSQLLILYANRKFGLLAGGQRAMVYFAPHTHARQKRLNELISDTFYRELYMSPCLSGWRRGENKHRYMQLCHKVLSRSQLNGIARLKEAGIITRDLVVLPSLSNVSLANNGTHISLGSRKLTRLMKDPASGFDAWDEKILGDLAIKIAEHFLPLFVGTYSAAPYRLDFSDFHPEKALGFLPHELDFTHLRMIWRRWKKKARLKVLGQPITPFGPKWIDRQFSRIFGLRGDFVRDYRLLDYFVALMSTDRSPALNGEVGNDVRLKQDLVEFGIFDAEMPMYLPYRLREYAVMGFSGFEGRYYSLFESIGGDMAPAAALQNLVTALAFKYIISGKITHAHIPDEPFVESERRQIFFGSAIGIPTFFIRKDTPNAFMHLILQRVRHTRPSHRYQGFIRVYNLEFRKALVDILRTDAADLVEMMGLSEILADLSDRIEAPETHAAADRLTRSILEEVNVDHPMKLPADVFNTASEQYYRETLRKRHMMESIDFLEQNFIKLDAWAALKRGVFREALAGILGLGHQGAWEFFQKIRRGIVTEEIDDRSLHQLIQLIILSIHHDIQQNREIETP
ncbi:MULTISPECIES: hypothetical protein [Desulfococcus]|uniref:hypothetical protein n=1 Tax=Desulfococcus TaxID=896 RepID=UPI00099058C7|nr:hypothetical protein [Desulfococcus multivorans]AQV02926.2 hypothetical protein B2D07_07235 [Desulfococcus multivorans]